MLQHRTWIQSQYAHGGSQTLVMPISGDLAPSLAFVGTRNTHDAHTYIHTCRQIHIYT